MIIDARSLENGAALAADVCIVGGGTAGLVLAAALAKSKRDVLLLESGGLKPDKRSEHLNFGENVGLPYYPLDTARARYLGGSTNRWHVSVGRNELGARIRPLDAIDFEARDYVPYSGWPFRKSDLDSYYASAQEACRTGPPDYEVAQWFQDAASAKLPLDDRIVNTILFKFATKQKFLSNHVEAVQRSENAGAVLYANVVEIETDDACQSVTRLQAACLNGARFSVSAKVYVLAAGGIEVPRLLLNSNKSMPCGLGNQNDLVGRFFMEHLHFWSGMFIPFGNQMINRTAIYNEIQWVNDVPVIAKLALSEAVMRKEGLINHNVQLIPRWVRRSSLYAHLHPDLSTNAPAGLKPLLSTVRRGLFKAGKLIDRRTALRYVIANMTEQVPNPESRISLGPERDALGLPRLKLNWQVTRQDVENAVRVQQILAGEIERSQLGRFIIQMADDTVPPGLHGGYHHMGTTRMSVDPKKGVVDPDGRVHGISNLFVAGPSVFPTGGHANPVLTIVALTLRLAEHIATHF